MGKTISEINAEARAMGLSYGKYVAKGLVKEDAPLPKPEGKKKKKDKAAEGER